MISSRRGVSYVASMCSCGAPNDSHGACGSGSRRKMKIVPVQDGVGRCQNQHLGDPSVPTCRAAASDGAAGGRQFFVPVRCPLRAAGPGGCGVKTAPSIGMRFTPFRQSRKNVCSGGRKAPVSGTKQAGSGLFVGGLPVVGRPLALRSISILRKDGAKREESSGLQAYTPKRMAPPASCRWQIAHLAGRSTPSREHSMPEIVLRGGSGGTTWCVISAGDGGGGPVRIAVVGHHAAQMLKSARSRIPPRPCSQFSAVQIEHDAALVKAVVGCGKVRLHHKGEITSPGVAICSTGERCRCGSGSRCAATGRCEAG